MNENISEVQKLTHARVLDLNLSALFSSSTVGHRESIRRDMIRQHKNSLTIDEIEKVQNLDLIPKSEKIFFSISHHQNLGGYTASDLAHGFDIELKSRISESIVRRVSTALEVSEAPDIQFLWCAKESIFKAISDPQLIISDLHVGNWSSQNKTGLWSFRIESNKALELNRNIGFVFHDNDQIFSIFFK